MTRKIDALLAEYGESHQNETNKTVHWICVPLIVWSVAALLWSLPVPGFLPVNWLTIVIALSIAYYLTLSVPLALGFSVFAAACTALIALVAAVLPWPVWQVALVVFALAWIGQFWGHKIEGKKPSFFEDVQFLLIGPAWLMSFLYKRWGIAY